MNDSKQTELETLLGGMTYSVVGDMPYQALAWNAAEQGAFTKEALLTDQQILVPFGSPAAYISAFSGHYAGPEGRAFSDALSAFCRELPDPLIYGYGFPRNSGEMTARRELERLPLGIPVITWRTGDGKAAGMLLMQGRRYRQVPFSAARGVDPGLAARIEARSAALHFPLSGRGWDVQNSWHLGTTPDRSALVETLLTAAGYLTLRTSMRDFLRLDEEEGDHSRELALHAFFQENFGKNELLTVYYSVMDEMWSIYYGLGYEGGGDVLGFSTIGFSM